MKLVTIMFISSLLACCFHTHTSSPMLVLRHGRNMLRVLLPAPFLPALCLPSKQALRWRAVFAALHHSLHVRNPVCQDQNVKAQRDRGPTLRQLPIFCQLLLCRQWLQRTTTYSKISGPLCWRAIISKLRGRPERAVLHFYACCKIAIECALLVCRSHP